MLDDSNTLSNYDYHGVASHYHNMFEGRCTSSGVFFSQSGNTAATFDTKKIPVGSVVDLAYKNPRTGKIYTVKSVHVTDIGHPRFQGKRELDLSKSVFQNLGIPLKQGLAPIYIKPIGYKSIRRLKQCMK